MATIKVTAFLTYEFDTEDGLVSSEEEAEQQVEEILSAGVSPWEYQTNTTVTD